MRKAQQRVRLKRAIDLIQSPTHTHTVHSSRTLGGDGVMSCICLVEARATLMIDCGR